MTRRVLVGCEFSGIVRDAFAAAGWDAWSCDLLPTERPGQHIQGDVLVVLDQGWDLAIFHPPCTHLAVSGAAWFKYKAQEQIEALAFVRLLMDAPIPRTCIENPVGVISSQIRKPDQIIQPWQFGADDSKATCLWLKGLPKLKRTQFITPRLVYSGNKGVARWANQTDSGQNNMPPSPERWRERSRTFPGIAQAMAEQWNSAERHVSYQQEKLFA